MPKSANTTRRRSRDLDEAPEWSADVFARAEVRHGDEVLRPAAGTLTKRGRPKLANPKRQVTLRLDSDVLKFFRDAGPGWQSRINEVLRKASGN
jgi:uncharacterized protein (DUF4415 family)